MKIFGRLFGGGGNGAGAGGSGAGGEPEPRPKDLCSESRVRVFEVATHVVYTKYKRTIQVDPKNIETGVTLPDCLLVAFYWNAIEMMGKAGVRHIEDLTGRDQAITGVMALAFDLNDVDFEAICQRLMPSQVEKARVFREKWIEAARREPRMAEIRRDVRDRNLRATEERVARKKALQALHKEPDAAAAYDIGCRQLLSGEPLGKTGATLYFLLPYGVQRMRGAGSETRPLWTDLPSHGSLTRQEKAVVLHLHKLLAALGDLDALFDLMTGRPQIETETGIFSELASDFAGHPMPREKLPIDRDKRSPHWPENASLPASYPSLFDAVLAMHASWNGPLPEPDVKT